MPRLSKPPTPTKEQLTLRSGHLAIGPKPRFTDIVKWCTVADPPTGDFRPQPSYESRSVAVSPPIDGSLTDVAWSRAVWSQPFGSIADGALVGYETRVAILWNEDYLFAGFRVQDFDIRAKTVMPNEHVYIQDDDVELFLDLGDCYLEIGVNPVNCTYQILWTWLDPVIQSEDWARLEELLKLPDYIYYTRRSTENLGRVGDRDYSLPGLRHAVSIDGSINNPASKDRGWSAEFAVPWASLAALTPTQSYPPRPGSTMRMQAYRAQHDWSQSNSSFLGDGSPFESFTWATMGNGNVHNPELWTLVQFEK
jgi:hypothetical protein